MRNRTLKMLVFPGLKLTGRGSFTAGLDSRCPLEPTTLLANPRPVNTFLRNYAFDKPQPVIRLPPPLIPRRRQALYKNLSIAVLLVVFGLVAARSTGTPAPTTTSPTIVRKVVLVNQTAPIPTTTIFTPGASGLFRVSVYMTQVSPGGADDSWSCNLNWTDDAGAESSSAVNFYGIITMGVRQTPPNAYGSLSSSGNVGNVVTIEAVAGQPITFSVQPLLGRSGGDGTYSLYLTVERLI